MCRTLMVEQIWVTVMKMIWSIIECAAIFVRDKETVELCRVVVQRSRRRDETRSPARGKVRGLTVGGLGPIQSGVISFFLLLVLCFSFLSCVKSIWPQPVRNRISFGRARGELVY